MDRYISLEDAIKIVEDMIDTYEKPWDEDYDKITESDIAACKVAVYCMKSVWYAKQGWGSYN